MQSAISLSAQNFQGTNVSFEPVRLDGEAAARVVKTRKLLDFDTNSYAKLRGSHFHNGIIEVDVCSRLLPDAPDFARGFIGIAFRIAEDDGQFEAFYLRPTNGRSCSDPARRQHAMQYFSYPTYTFAYFREHGVTQYEAPAEIDLGEWMHIKAVVQDDRADFYLNGADVPALSVPALKLGPDAAGAVGLFVDIGTEGFYKNLTVTCTDGGAA